MERNITGLVDAALATLVEARRRNSDEAQELDDAQNRRLGVAITACHTVLEPPAAPTDELRAMGLWWDA